MDLVDRLRGVLGNAGEGKVFDSSVVKPTDRQCAVCDSIFGTVVRRVVCRLCGRAVCQDCAKNVVPAPMGSPDPAPLRACEYCFHMRQRPHYDAIIHEHILARTSVYSGLLDDEANIGPGGALLSIRAQRSTLAAKRMRLRFANRYKQAQGDLTWDVPPELDPDWGLNSADKERRDQQAAQQHLQPALQTDAEPQAEDAEGAAPAQHNSMRSLQHSLFAAAAQQHLAKVVAQLLRSKGVARADTWSPIITRLAVEAADTVAPAALIAHGVPDPTHYIKVKKLADVGEPEDSCVVSAVVCKRNVAHRRMRTQLDSPRVLLLGGALEYQQGAAAKLSTIENLVGTEQDALMASLARIAALEPDLLVVEKSVARVAQEALLDQGITLVLNVKPELMERLGRCIGARVVPSVDQLTPGCLGSCRDFRVETVQSNPTPGLQLPARTVMSFGYPAPLGSTILLKGADEEQLVKIKQVMRFAVTAAYAGRLEASYLAEEVMVALAAAGEEVPLHVATGGLEAYKSLVSAAISASVTHSATSMPNGVVISISPHTSVWDHSLAQEFDSAVQATVQNAVAAAAAAAHRGSAALSPHRLTAGGQIAVGDSSTGASTGGGALGIGHRESDATAAAALASSLYGLAIKQEPGSLGIGGSQGGTGAGAVLAGGGQSVGGHAPMPSAFAAASVALAATASSGEQQAIGGGSTGDTEAGAAAAAGTGEGGWVSRNSLDADQEVKLSASAMAALAVASGQHMLAPNPSILPGGSGAPGGQQSQGGEEEEGHEPKLSASALAALAVASGQHMPFGGKLVGSSRASHDLGTGGGALPNGTDSATAAAAAVYTPSFGTSPPGGGMFARPVGAGSSGAEGYTTATTSPAHVTGSVVGSTLGSPGCPAQFQGQGDQRQDAAAPALHVEYDPIAELLALQGLQVMNYTRIQIAAFARPTRLKDRMMCEPPGLQQFHMFARNDMCLAQFITLMGRLSGQRCTGYNGGTGCGDLGVHHARTFLHGTARITLSVTVLPEERALPDEEKNQVWMWFRPKGKGLDSAHDIRRVPLSQESSCMSFAQFLQLVLTGDELCVVGRRLHYDFVRYFGIGNTVICMYQDRIMPHETIQPQYLVTYSPAAQLKWLRQEAEELSALAEEMFSHIEHVMTAHPLLQGKGSPPAAAAGPPMSTGGGGTDSSGLTTPPLISSSPLVSSGGAGILAAAAATVAANRAATTGGMPGEAGGPVTGVEGEAGAQAGTTPTEASTAQSLALGLQTPSGTLSQPGTAPAGALSTGLPLGASSGALLRAEGGKIPSPGPGGADTPAGGALSHLVPHMRVSLIEDRTRFKARVDACLAAAQAATAPPPPPPPSSVYGACPTGPIAASPALGTPLQSVPELGEDLGVLRAAHELANSSIAGDMSVPTASARTSMDAAGVPGPPLGVLHLHHHHHQLHTISPGVTSPVYSTAGGVQGLASTGGALPLDGGAAGGAAHTSVSLLASRLSAMSAASGGHSTAGGMTGGGALPPPTAPHPSPLDPQYRAARITQMVEAAQELNKARSALAVTLLSWAATLQDPANYPRLCQESRASTQLGLSLRSSFDAASQGGTVSLATPSNPSTAGSAPPPSTTSDSASAATGLASSNGVWASDLEGSKERDRDSAAPPSSTSRGLFASLSNASALKAAAAEALAEVQGAGGVNAPAVGLPIPIVPSSGGPIPVQAVADLVVRASLGGAPPQGPSQAEPGAGAGGTASQQGPPVPGLQQHPSTAGGALPPAAASSGGSILEGTQAMLGLVPVPAAAQSGRVMSRRQSMAGGESMGGGASATHSATTSPGPSSQLPAPSDHQHHHHPHRADEEEDADDDEEEQEGEEEEGDNDGDDEGDDEDEEEEEDEEDGVTSAYGYGGLLQQGAARRLGPQDDDEEYALFYPSFQGYHEADNSTGPSPAGTGGGAPTSAAAPHSALKPMSRLSNLTSALASHAHSQGHQQEGGEGGEGGPHVATGKRVRIAGLPPVHPSTKLHHDRHHHHGEGASVAGSVSSSPPNSHAGLAALHGDLSHSMGGSGFESAGSRSILATANENLRMSHGSLRSSAGRMDIKSTPSMKRAMQSMRRKLEAIVGGPESAPIGRLRLPGRAILPAGVLDVMVPIHDSEISSIVAHFLASKAYAASLNAAIKEVFNSVALAALQQREAQAGGLHAGGGGPAHGAALAGQTEGGEVAGGPGPAPPATQHPHHQAPATVAGQSGGSVLSGSTGRHTEDEWLQVLRSPEPAHVGGTFEDEGLGTPWTRCRFKVTVYYAAQFAELRRRVVQGGEAAFITSMSRCVRWAQRGGKSNAYFAKTRDDRYIIKSLSKPEKQSFMRFAPAYFEHMVKMLSGQQTTLARILGVFTVHHKPAAGGVASSTAAGANDGLDLLVIENCFYDRPISRIYDLKGSERNRFNAQAAANQHDPKEVHLDDNLRLENARAPLLVEPCSVEQLFSALWMDTHFLSDLGVIDYSLIVGVDRENNALVVAMIDYIRTYTLDKRMETLIKGSGLMGGDGKDPTIISPKAYMRRFRAAIQGYLTIVPATADVADPLPVEEPPQTQ